MRNPWHNIGKFAWLLAFGFLLFVAGLSAASFRQPSYERYERVAEAFVAWRERLQQVEVNPPANVPESVRVTLNMPGAYAGYTLFTNSIDSTVTLIDMDGTIVHRWTIPFSRVWPQPRHTRAVADDRVYITYAYMFGNGDLLAVYNAKNDTPFGYGLVKVDKDAKVLWSYDGNVHHDISVSENGNIYALTHSIRHKVPEGYPFLPVPALTDQLVELSPDGRELAKIELLDAFRGTGFEETLRNPSLADPKKDYFHANSAMRLDASVAGAFPQFKEGQVLLSLRNQNALAVLDMGTRKIVWMDQGVWRQQHAAKFLSSGNILIFDNRGSYDRQIQSRVMEFDPATGAIVWAYPGNSKAWLYSFTRSSAERLPNGNTLITNSGSARAIEVDREGREVWNMSLYMIKGYDILQNTQRIAYDEVSFITRGVLPEKP